MRQKNDFFNTKQIKSVEFTGEIYESYPGKYGLVVNYTDGSKAEKILTGEIVAKLYFDYLSPNDKKYFAHYLKDDLKDAYSENIIIKREDFEGDKNRCIVC